MNKPFKFILPPPDFNKNNKDACRPRPHFLTPSGMSLLPREKQPPPMYGKHGATVPARYLPQQTGFNRKQTEKTQAEKQYCEPCELEFHSTDDLKCHRAQHEKCPVAGCNYKGHPSVMDKHINALHNSGLFEKFKKLSTPEEIAAWREERRKRYPTLANVLLKKKAQEQRQKRGERLEANKNRFGKVNDRKRAQPNTVQDKNQNVPSEDNLVENNSNKRKRKTKRKPNNRNQDRIPVQNIDSKRKMENNQIQDDNHDVRFGIKVFAGTSMMKDYEHFSDKKTIKNKVLFGLVGMYGSDYDDDDNDSDGQSDKEDMKLDVEHKFKNNTNSSIEDIESIESMKGNTNKFESLEQRQINNTQNENKFFQLSPESTKITPVIKSEGFNHDNMSLNNKTHSEMQQLEPEIRRQLHSLNASIPANFNDDNYSDEGPEEAPIQKNPTSVLLNSKAAISEVPEIVPPVKRSKEESKTTLRPRLLVKRKYGLDYRSARLRKQNTMLEKLLETDIRHERNVLLQCVRYVCEHNYFGIGQNNQGKQSQ